MVHYGIETHGDAGLAFAEPGRELHLSAVVGARLAGANRPAGADAKLGDFHDSFGHPLTVLAVANPLPRFRAGVLDAERDKAAGLGIVRFDKRSGTIKVECWPFLADVTRPGTQFPGWPVTVHMLDNYARRPVAWLPLLEFQGVDHPVVQVIEDRSGEVVYTLRIAGRELPAPCLFGRHVLRQRQRSRERPAQGPSRPHREAKSRGRSQGRPGGRSEKVMKITGIDCHILLAPDYDATACSSAQDDLVIEVHTDEGIVGVGETDTNPWVVRECLLARGTHCMGLGLHEMLLCADPMQPELTWERSTAARR